MTLGHSNPVLSIDLLSGYILHGYYPLLSACVALTLAGHGPQGLDFGPAVVVKTQGLKELCEQDGYVRDLGT